MTATLHTRMQILVILKDGVHLIIDPSDKVTHGENDDDVQFPEGVMWHLTGGDNWVDLWQPNVTTEGEPSMLALRVFASNVASLTRAFIFPKPEDMAQS